LVDFSKFDVDGNGWVDAVFVVHAGPGGEVTGNPWDIWSHAWATSYPIAVDNVLVYGYSMEPEDGRIGVFSHELGHVLGLPDLYDYGGDSNGLGDWTIMAGGSWGNGGITPVHFDAWCKTKLGFITPIEVAPGTLDVVQLPPVEYSQVVYKMYMDNQPDFQYFLVENRRKKGFDYYLPGPGLLIYHCDDTVSTGNNLQWYPGYTDSGHFLVALEQADGQWGLEKNYGSNNGDPYPGTWSKFTLNDTTIPDTRTYSFLSTGVCVEKISTSMDTMTASLCGGSPIGILQSSAEGKMQSAKLGQNVPNPFRSATLISYTLSSASHVSVEIYDLSGALVETLKDGMDGPGAHQVYWNPKNHESGIFFYRLKAGAFEYTRKMILVR
jgi:immune inhibitor A